jgi:phosphoribosylglycinamide formyltransferase-1
MKSKIALFASGSGTNVDNICNYFKGHSSIVPKAVFCNNKYAGVWQVAAKHQLPVVHLEKERFFRGDAYMSELVTYQIDWIVLAGFLWKIPAPLISAHQQRIINIHPALLPKYGGKGMYGRHVHEAVIHSGDLYSGITIHYVDELYDHGATILQATCPVKPDDSAESLARRIHQLEHRYYPQVIEDLCG